MSSTISASVSGSVVNASVSGSPASISVGQQSGAIQASIAGGSIAASGGPQIAPVQSVNGRVGHVVLPLSPASPLKPPEMALMTTVMFEGTFSFSARSNSGYFAVLWWDGTVQTFGIGVPNQYYLASKAIPSFGNWSGSSPKPVMVWPCISLASAALYGGLTGLACTSKRLSHLFVDGCASLTELSCDTNQLRSLRFPACPSLVSISCHFNGLTELDVSECPALTSLYCQSNLLEGINVTNNASLQILSCSLNRLTSLDVSSNPLLVGLYCMRNMLTSLDLRPNPLLTGVLARDNLLTSIRATGIKASSAVGMNVAGNLLDAAALNTLYSDLSAVPAGPVYVSGNPGAAFDNPSIATSKGYVVYG